MRRHVGIGGRAAVVGRPGTRRRARSHVIFGSGCGAGPQAHVLRNHKVGRMCSGAASGPRLCAVIRIARSSGSALAYSMKMSK